MFYSLFLSITLIDDMCLLFSLSFLFYHLFLFLFVFASVAFDIRMCTDRPLCRSDQKRVYGVARNEQARILCEVDAYPPPTAFKWSFNNTAETIDMPQNGFEKHSKSSSRLVYTPVKVCVQLLLYFDPFDYYCQSTHTHTHAHKM